jgi:hypothetical protein
LTGPWLCWFPEWDGGWRTKREVVAFERESGSEAAECLGMRNAMTIRAGGRTAITITYTFTIQKCWAYNEH